jgi:Second Messenger Oligonucleotide or Dinucleotide Synthetase domain
MDIDAAFDDLQSKVNAPPEAVKEARRRRDLFRDAFGGEADVTETVPSGSLARGSQKDPINDVDVIIVFDQDEHPDWGQPDSSAADALDHVQARVHELLGVTEGTFAKEVRLARVRNHAVKCWLDDPNDPDAFTVDVTPALRVPDDVLRIPEKRSRDWIKTAPEYLIRLVADRHSSWNRFVGLVRVLKRWGADQQTDMKSLLLEVMALDHLYQADRPKALAQFFTAAATAVRLPVLDPAGLCGEIQPDLDRSAASDHFARAAEAAWRAVEAEAREDTDRAACLWRTVFGSIFPEPPGGCGDGGGGLGSAAAVPLVIPPRRRPVREAPQGRNE